jgi:hypothetical protein
MSGARRRIRRRAGSARRRSTGSSPETQKRAVGLGLGHGFVLHEAGELANLSRGLWRWLGPRVKGTPTAADGAQGARRR